MSPERQMPEEISGTTGEGAEALTEEEQAALDRELAQMARETPDMPDDFHARWTQQIREEAEKDPALADEARCEFHKLEEGDPENTRLWKLFKEISLKRYMPSGSVMIHRSSIVLSMTFWPSTLVMVSRPVPSTMKSSLEGLG